jgi:hypothetical protein
MVAFIDKAIMVLKVLIALLELIRMVRPESRLIYCFNN